MVPPKTAGGIIKALRIQMVGFRLRIQMSHLQTQHHHHHWQVHHPGKTQDPQLCPLLPSAPTCLAVQTQVLTALIPVRVKHAPVSVQVSQVRVVQVQVQVVVHPHHIAAGNTSQTLIMAVKLRK